MIKNLIITDIAIWVNGAGHISRLKALINFLTKHSHITVIYLGPNPQYSIEQLLPPKVSVIQLDNQFASDKANNLKYIEKLCAFEQYTMCFFEYIHHSFYLQCLPDSVITVLDTHDIISDRNASFTSLNYDILTYELTREREYKIFHLYDYVMFISETDYVNSKYHMPEDNMILAPHPSPLAKHDCRENVLSVGFIASDYLPNVDSISWFLVNVWPRIVAKHNITLDLYGAVCSKIPQKLIIDGVHLHGFMPDLASVYREIDVVINPVRIGSGLKIKNVEALANGLPLITTTHGANGLQTGINKAFLVANNEEEYLKALFQLINNYEFRFSLSNRAFEFACQNFNEDACFHRILEVMKYAERL